MGDVVSSVDSYTPADFAHHVARRAKAHGYSVVATGGMTRACGRLVRDFDNRYRLVLAMEHVLGTFAEVVGVNERLLTISVMDISAKELGHPDQPWEALYFKRFAATDDEREFFDLWLGVLEDTETANPGSPPRLGEDLYQKWSDIKIVAEIKLGEAVTIIRQRFAEHDKLEEHLNEGEPEIDVDEITLQDLILQRHGTTIMTRGPKSDTRRN